MYFGQQTRTLPDFAVGDRVRIKNENNRVFDIPGIIGNRTEKPRSYDILTESGRILKRNRKHIIRDSNNGLFEIVRQHDGNVSIRDKNTRNELDASTDNDQRRERVLDYRNNQEEGRNEVPRRSNRQIKKSSYLKDYVED